MKKILVLYKKSFYAQSLANLKAHPSLSRGFLASERSRFLDMHQKHMQTLACVKDVVARSGIDYQFCLRGRCKDYKAFDLVITVGGDGTFLHAARRLDKQTILGVNSDPERSVGKFCAANSENFENIFLSVRQGRRRPQPLTRLEVWSKDQGVREHIVNDLLVCDKNPAAMSRYVLWINGFKEYQRSSGLWIATAAGSSGAIQSAGGRVLALCSSKIVYQPRELYYKKKSEFRLTGRAVDLKTPMRIRSQMVGGIIFLDGAHVKIPFGFGQEIFIQRSRQPLYAIV